MTRPRLLETPPTELPELLTKQVTAQYMSVSDRTLQKITYPRGTLKAVKLPTGGLRYRRSTVEAWIAAHESPEATK